MAITINIFFAVIFLSLIITGCVPLKKIAQDESTDGRQHERLIGPREAAIQRYGYKGIEENITAEFPVITPSDVRHGDTIRQQLQFGILSDNKEDRFFVVETIVILIGNEPLELLKIESEKEQGVYLSDVQIILPKDLRPGQYHLITTITSGEIKKIVTGSFNVKK